MPIGSNFDDFLKEEGLYEVATASAMKKVLALQISEAMKAPATHQNRHGQAHAHQPGRAESPFGRYRYQPDTDDAGKCCCGLGSGGED